MISMYHEDTICTKINKTNKEETKAVVLYDYSQHGSNYLGDLMLQPYLFD
jgi:hypothetical protein